mmetsp:Transcript_28283/g.33530  ORF Transcript_28283/g.33530 Transcript_28283/m.33530 type:complete len:200 (+) Transcript_28283:2924-3523(+)
MGVRGPSSCNKPLAKLAAVFITLPSSDVLIFKSCLNVACNLKTPPPRGSGYNDFRRVSPKYCACASPKGVKAPPHFNMISTFVARNLNFLFFLIPLLFLFDFVVLCFEDLFLGICFDKKFVDELDEEEPNFLTLSKDEFIDNSSLAASFLVPFFSASSVSSSISSSISSSSLSSSSLSNIGTQSIPLICNFLVTPVISP